VNIGMDQEQKRYYEIRREDEPNEAKHLFNILNFLIGTNYILYDYNFLQDVEKTIEILLPHYPSGDVHSLLQLLKKKLVAIDEDIKASIPKNIKKLGKGGYGCVVQPALPNRKNDTWVPHEKDVSKLYFSKTTATKAFRDSASLYNDLKNDGHKMFVQRLYKGSDFPPFIQQNCEISPNMELMSLRAPNLGISINNISDHYLEFRKFPFGRILEQIVKLFSQLNVIQEKGYIHGDIRDANVMANPKTGQLTLIDFDWYMPKDKFFRDYFQSLGFLSNPPESLLNYDVVRFLKNGIQSVNLDPKKLYNYVKGGNISGFRGRLNKLLTAQDVIAANKENIKRFASFKYIEEYCDAMFPYFDSYGLGLALLEFCSYVYPYRAPLKDRLTDGGRVYTSDEMDIIEKTIEKLYVILFRLIRLDIANRLSAKTSFLLVTRLYEEYNEDLRSLTSNNLEMSARRHEVLDAFKPKGVLERQKGQRSIIAPLLQTKRRKTRRSRANQGGKTRKRS